MKEISYFDVMMSLVSKKRIPDGDVLKHYNGYMSFVWLSSHPKAVYDINTLNSARGNRFFAKEKLAEYYALKGLVQIDRRTKIPFVKKDKHLETIMTLVQTHYKVGKTTAKEYYKILSPEQILGLLELHARKNEKYLSATDTKSVQDIRSALTAKKKDLLKGLK